MPQETIVRPTKEQRERIDLILQQVSDGIKACFDLVPDEFDWSEYSDPSDAHELLCDPDAEVGRLWAVYAWLDYGEEADEQERLLTERGPDHFTGFDDVCDVQVTG